MLICGRGEYIGKRIYKTTVTLKNWSDLSEMFSADFRLLLISSVDSIRKLSRRGISLNSIGAVWAISNRFTLSALPTARL